MTDESHSFTAAKTRLEEIVTQVRKKDTSLEKSLDLLEEGVRLANVCTELIDQTDWNTSPPAEGAVDRPAVESGTGVEPDAQSPEVPEPDEARDAEPSSPEVADATNEEVADSPEPTAGVGEVWSDDEAWADEEQDDPSNGDDGHVA